MWRYQWKHHMKWLWYIYPLLSDRTLLLWPEPVLFISTVTFVVAAPYEMKIFFITSLDCGSNRNLLLRPEPVTVVVAASYEMIMMNALLFFAGFRFVVESKWFRPELVVVTGTWVFYVYCGSSSGSAIWNGSPVLRLIGSGPATQANKRKCAPYIKYKWPIQSPAKSAGDRKGSHSRSFSLITYLPLIFVLDYDKGSLIHRPSRQSWTLSNIGSFLLFPIISFLLFYDKIAY